MRIAGVDEAGRGPLAGPVYAAAVILNPKKRILGLKDSKLLTAEKRAALFDKIIARALAWGIGSASVEEIDILNIFQATMLSMQRAVEKLIHFAPGIFPDRVLIDGNKCPLLDFPTEAIVEGDKTEAAISAASILAKVSRDRKMTLLDKQYPGYGFAQHKGYSTDQHLEALEKLGVCEIHRKSYLPVKLRLDRQLAEVEIFV